MPPAIQAITFIVPARYFIVALRSIVLKGADLSTFWTELAALAVYAAVMLTLASKAPEQAMDMRAVSGARGQT
jgi:ABC-2 type transport system permease protein